MQTDRAQAILNGIGNVKIAVYGDFCLDAYWILNPNGSEISVETGLQGQGVNRHYYSLGGASNIIANLAAMKPAAISVIGVVGGDIFGRELTRQLTALNVDTSSLVIQAQNFDTYTFAKRYLQDQEQPRIDFGFFNRRTTETDNAILAGLRRALETADAVIFNQQVPGSITNEEFIIQANALFDEFNDRIVLLDSRHYADKFHNVYRKTNDIEAAHLAGADVQAGDVIDPSDLELYARQLRDRSGKPVFITRGAHGILALDDQGAHEVPGIQLLKKIDTVGAGDTTISALGLGLAAGFDPAEATRFANIAAAVTVQKLFRTGTAAPDEILELTQDVDYIYQPELAADSRRARHLRDSDIEICYEYHSLPLGRIEHAVFDHDGTISVLRQGWEEIMAPVMIHAILGDRYDSAHQTLYHKVVNRVGDYIDKSTGIQTIVQMEALVEMVREFGVVPSQQILDAQGYKDRYNRALMDMVNQRLERFHAGQLDLDDYTIKGALDFLRSLRQKGITLYLASGTDCADVIREAEALGYSDLFEGRIYGSLGDISKYSKKMVIEKIMKENQLSGPELAVFGDGPVEIRECRKRQGLAVAIASDEVRRYGLNAEKRKRLIRAGAHLLIPDFSQRHGILAALKL